ncbi:aldo/keto reductase [Staphylococcus massiliensis]|uniref:aldo/keto reductase n=1 Tax=Staphylococcus massiliensis TaxID=555791 RepID=UPI001EDDEFCB|nr:aldo/keto reductase [Staphylococcus massiliensis]MCG3401837.1 aldo/keto reductase [Staphylococcus massiliensis]
MNDSIHILNNGKHIPKVGLGVYKITEEDMYDSIKSALEAGYRLFDTAFMYDNEKELGQALKDLGVQRDEVFITTKIWNDYQGYDSTLTYFNKSLDNLGMDYVDLILVHWPCEKNGKYIETYKALEHLCGEGKAKSIGVANFKPHHIDKLIEQTEIIPQVNQIECHPYFNQQETQDYCDQNDIAVQAWMPIMRNRGLLDDEVIVELAEKYGKTPAQVVLRWHIEHGRLVIPKSKTKERIEENINIFNFSLEEADIERIDNLNKDIRQGKDPDKISIGDLK